MAPLVLIAKLAALAEAVAKLGEARIPQLDRTGTTQCGWHLQRSCT
jgi:hypothetical protein